MDIFKKHIGYIENSGYTFLLPKNLNEIFDKEKLKKKILLTIDDGYVSFYNYTWPYFK